MMAPSIVRLVNSAIKMRPSRIIDSSRDYLVKETYNSLRTKLLSINSNVKCPTYIVISPFEKDGKTLSCKNIALSFAEIGKKTLLIDANLRQPTIHKSFNLDLNNGISELLEGSVKTVNFHKSEINNLSILTAGTSKHNPADLLSSARMDQLLDYVQKNNDIVFIDTPALYTVSDALIFAKKVTGYILVIKNGTTEMEIVRQTVKTLEQAGANIAGFLLNDVNPRNQRYYKSYM
jgi:capsular exopolysaccharide synthesis family protein